MGTLLHFPAPERPIPRPERGDHLADLVEARTQIAALWKRLDTKPVGSREHDLVSIPLGWWLGEAARLLEKGTA